MANASETKVTRRNAILTTGKAAVAFGAAALLAGRLPNIQPLDTGDNEDKDADEEAQPTGGLRTAVVSYKGTDPNDTDSPTDIAADLMSGGVSSNPVDLGLVPIQFVISEVSTYNPITGATSGTPATSRNTVSVMTVGGDSGDDKKHIFVNVWTDQQGAQAILPTSSTRPIVVGKSVDVEALEDAVRGLPNLSSFTINNQGTTYLILAFGSHSTGPSQDDDDNDIDG